MDSQSYLYKYSLKWPVPNHKYFLNRKIENQRSEQVLAAPAIYCVLHKNSPISIRSVNNLLNDKSAKYKAVSFAGPAHCVNLAKRLNEKFNTTDFTAARITDGWDIIYEEQRNTDR